MGGGGDGFRNAAVAGGTGFLGRHLLDEIRARRRWKRVVAVERPLEEAGAWRRALENGEVDTVWVLAYPRRKDWDVLGEAGIRRFVERSCDALDRAMEGLPAARLVCVSSAAVYGASAVPVDEDHQCEPAGTYGRCKLLQERLLQTAAERHGWRCTVARVFNVLGPGQPPGFFPRDLIDRLRAAPNGSALPTGPLHTVRDFLDVRDVARALAMDLGDGIANVCSGAPVRMSDIAGALVHLLGTGIRLLPPPETDGGVSYSCGSTARLRAAGFLPEVPLRRSLEDQLAG